MGAAQVLGGRLGAYRRWSKPTTLEARQAATAKARAALQARFDAEPDPGAAKRLYYAEIALKRHRTLRRRRKAA